MAISDAPLLRQRARGVWTCYQATVIALCVTLLGAGLRLYRADANGLRLDELYSIWMAERGVLDIVRAILIDHIDPTPPAYYLLLHLFLQFGQHLLLTRAISIVAGTLTIWFTFRLAAYLFDLRVATLSALLIAVAPLHIEYSQVARAYMLSDLLGLLSLYFFAQLLFGEQRKRLWIGFVAVTVAMLYTHYLLFLLVVFENAFVASLWLRRRVSRQLIVPWAISQVVLAIALLPLAAALLAATPAGAQVWLTRPGVQTLARSAILFSTGDPSYGPTGLTAARVLSFITVVGISILGLWVLLRHRYHQLGLGEARRVWFVGCAVVLPWMTAFALSQVRNVYKEKYLLFLAAPLFVLFAWVLIRARGRLVATLLLLALSGLTGSALFVYYTAPAGEQWREAIAYMRPTYQPDDLVIISPGFYARPFVYYSYGDFPEDLRSFERMLPLERAAAVLVRQGELKPLRLESGEPGLAAAQRIWLLSGFVPADPAVTRWIEQHFEPLDSVELLGARVQLLRRVRNTGRYALTGSGVDHAR